MNKNYTSIIVLVIVLFFGVLSAQETQKNFINYQGVARNASNELMAGEAMTVGVALKFGTANSSSMYEESHSITTDANGVFSLLIGNGSPANGDYNTLPWGSAATFVTVSINGKEIGTTEMMAVPYAISSGDANQNATQVAYDNTASSLNATTAQAAIDELSTGGIIDADGDPSNEFQTLSFDEGTNELSLSDGNAITIPSGGTDADADPTNEIQTISFDPTSNKITLTDGGDITIPIGRTDADSDPENELQTLAFDNGTNELSLSDGNSVTIPSGGTDADSDPTNEIQDISLSGTELSISDGSTIDLAPIVPPGGSDDQNLILSGDELSIENGTGLVDLGSYRDDADADATNELQNLSFNSGTRELSLSDGNSVTIPDGSGGSSLWKESGGNIYYNSGNIGLGLTNPQKAWMHIQSNSTVSKPHLLIEEEGADYARIALKNNQSVAYWHIAGRPSMNSADSKLNFYHHNGTAGHDRMTILGNGNVGVNTANPKTKLDVNGSFNISGDFANQSMHKVSVFSWEPHSSANGREVFIPGVELNINVPEGSRVLLGFEARTLIDSNTVSYHIIRDEDIHYTDYIAWGKQDFYEIAGSREKWHINLVGLDATVPPGNHRYRVRVLHSDDAEDGGWYGMSFFAVVLKE